MIRILLAEDDAAMRQYLERALEKAGYAVTAVDRGTAALPLLEQERFDLLLTDIKMPVMDGIALALTAARDYPELPILLMTGYADQRERAKNLESLVRDVLVKPFSLADLRGSLQTNEKLDEVLQGTLGDRAKMDQLRAELGLGADAAAAAPAGEPADG